MTSSFRLISMLPVTSEIAWRFVVEHGHEIEVISFEAQSTQGVGTLNRLTFRFLGMSLHAVSRTVTWDPPSKCVFESVKPSWPVTMRITEEFSARHATTEHTINYEITSKGVIGSIVAPILCRLMKRNRRQYQERLRLALLDTGSSRI